MAITRVLAQPHLRQPDISLYIIMQRDVITARLLFPASAHFSVRVPERYHKEHLRFFYFRLRLRGRLTTPRLMISNQANPGLMPPRWPSRIRAKASRHACRSSLANCFR